MKKTLSTLFVLFLCVIGISAQLRQERDAFQVAKSFAENHFMQFRNSTEDFSLELAYAPKTTTGQTGINGKEEKTYYYIYNIGKNNGFVIVSGDERTKKILGYGENSSFDEKRIPEGLQYWLNYYKEELDILASFPEEKIISSTKETENTLRNNDFAPSIAPLVKARWDQGYPYNYAHPEDDSYNEKVPVGCTAIASAQIMHYYQWPKRGIGSVTHSVLGRNKTINLAQTKYDWGNMKSFYDISIQETDETVKAVSDFLFHVSFAIKSQYSVENGTGAYTSDMASALINNFGYDKGIQIYKKEFYSAEDWKNLVKAELNASRPIHYAGYSGSLSSGHAFVCDGYDSNGLFHFNWGWSGISDGYFELSALTPGGLGIGGGSGNYNRGQEMILGIQPATTNSQKVYQLYCDYIQRLSKETIARNETIEIQVDSVYNYGINEYNGQMGLGLFDGNELKAKFALGTITGLPYGRGKHKLELSGTLPSSVADGNYKLYAIYKSNDQTEWKILRGREGFVNYLNTSISSSSIVISEPTDVLPNLQVVQGNSVQNVYKNKTSRVVVTLKNTGGGDYTSFISLAFDKSGDEIFAKEIPVVVAAGETKELIVLGTALRTAGTYGLYVLSDKTNDYGKKMTVIDEEETIKVKVIELNDNSIKVDLKSIIHFPDNNKKITPSTFNLNVPLKNMSGDAHYEGKITLVADIGEESFYYIDSKIVQLNPGEETVLTFTNPPYSLPYGNVELLVYYYNPATGYADWFPSSATKGKITFDYQADAPTGIDDVTESNMIDIYPNPAIDILNVSAEENIQSVTIYDLSGKQIMKNNYSENKISIPVNYLNNGLYIIQIETGSNSTRMKFLKK